MSCGDKASEADLVNCVTMPKARGYQYTLQSGVFFRGGTVAAGHA